MGAHPLDDAIWGCTDPSVVSIDIENNTEIMAGSHIREEQIFTFCRSDLHEFLNMAVHVPCKDDLSWYGRPDFMDNYHNWNKPLNIIDTVNSRANIAQAHVTNQEHQNYYDWWDQQYIAYKYNSGLEQVTLESAPNIIVE